MKRDYSVIQRAEDTWDEMRKSVNEQRLLKLLSTKHALRAPSGRGFVIRALLRLSDSVASLWPVKKAAG